LHLSYDELKNRASQIDCVTRMQIRHSGYMGSLKDSKRNRGLHREILKKQRRIERIIRDFILKNKHSNI